MHTLRDVFGPAKPVIGMIHVQALPGTPAYGGNMAPVIEQAVWEAELYQRCGLPAVMIENMHDTPYLRRQAGPEITAAMTAVAIAVKRACSLPCGVQVLAGANREALAVALAAGLEFIRAEGFAFAHVADEGLLQSDAGELLRYRRVIGADRILVLTDIKKKHSAHAITADVSLAETARAAEFFRSDGLIITGSATGEAASVQDVRAAREASSLPLLIGSGIGPDNISEYWPYCDGVIVGSSLKVGGYWANSVEESRVAQLMEVVGRL
ncbi:MAG: BtpA/SgcQ family protein [Phaeodactylibacter sp.]|nr:BtpA/SgcQ family protein [Phaeodactylibacter sp.]MCB9292893.1 BtpA/SgcQ family protein [Lewinellaceae bacterium]